MIDYSFRCSAYARKISACTGHHINAVAERLARQRAREKAYRAERKAKKLAENGGEIIHYKTCECCGNQYVPTSNRQKYCSKDCWGMAYHSAEAEKRREKRTVDTFELRNCTVCGNTYQPVRFHQTMCSGECRRKHHNEVTLALYHRKHDAAQFASV